MKRCPNCNRTYADDSQKFCTHDGGRLVTEVQATMTLPDLDPNFDPNATVHADMPDFKMSPPSQRQPPPQPVHPPAPDLNATIAAPQPPMTGDFRRPDTGPIGPSAPSNPLPSTPAPPPQSSAPWPEQRPASVPSSDFGATMMDVPASPPPSTPVAQPSTFQPPPSAYAQSPGAAQAPVSVQMPAPPVAAEPTARPARKSKTGLIIGLVAVFLVLVIAAAAALFFTVIRPRMLANANTNTESNGNTGTDQNANANTSPNANGNESANANTNTGIDTNIMNAPPVTPPPNSAKFINSSGSLDGALVEHYVDFSFYYPQAWKKDPNSGVRGASNFVKVERIQPPNYTLENAAISWYASKGSYDTDKDLFPKLVEKLSSSYSQNTQRFPAYRKVSEGETMVGPYKGYEFRFESSISDAGSGGKLWGRIIFLPPVSTDETDGLVMYLLATSLATELTSADDVGVKGELPMILETFRFGKEQ